MKDFTRSDRTNVLGVQGDQGDGCSAPSDEFDFERLATVVDENDLAYIARQQAAIGK